MIYSSLCICQEYVYKHYTIDDGLLTNHVYGCIKDSQGYMWFFTEKGVSKFNGNTFKHFTTQQGLPTNDVWNLTEDDFGRIWIHSRSNQLSYIWKDRVYSVENNGVDVYNITALSSVGDSVILINGSDISITTCYNNQLIVKEYEQFLDLVNDYLGFLFQKVDKRLEIILDQGDEGNILITPYGEYRVLTGRQNAYQHSKGVSSYVMDDEHSLIVVFENIEDIIIDLKEIYGNKPSRIRISKFDKKVQISSSLGVVVVDENGFIEVFKFNDFLQSLNTSRSIIDDQGNIWISTLNEGCYQIAHDLIEIDKYNLQSRDFQPEFHLIHDDVLYLLDLLDNMSKYKILPNGDLKFIDEDKLNITANNIRILRESVVVNGVIPLTKESTFDYNYFQEYIEDDQLKKLDSLQKEILITGLRDKRFFKKVAESDDHIFIGIGAHPFMVNKMTKEIFVGKKNAIKFYEFLENDKFIMCSIHSLIVFDQKDIDFKEIHRFDFRIASTTYSDNTCFIGLENGELYKYENSKLTQIHKSKFNSIEHLGVDDAGRLYVLTDHSLYKFDGKNLHLVFNHGRVQNEEFNSFEIHKDNIFLISKNNIFGISKDNTPKPLETDLIFEYIKVNEDLVEEDSLTSLKYNQNNIHLVAAFLDFATYGNTEFEWTIKSKNLAYNYTGAEVKLNNLKPGNYELDLRAKANGVYSKTKSINFNIEAPIWSRYWFIALMLISSVYLGFQILKWFINRKNRIKQAELIIQKKFTDLELQALRSQLNPHFMFNALGSIQSLIQSNRKSDADQYLARFAGLLRSFLDCSRLRFINLEKELEIISSYVELEKLRFGEIDFSVNNKTTSSLSEIRIPSLILQPSIENIFLHAFESDQDDKEIVINISESKNSYEIEILDNGIGIESSRRLYPKRNSKGSLGIKLIKDRISVLNDFGESDFDMKVMDRSKNKEKGTKVTLKIPKSF